MQSRGGGDIEPLLALRRSARAIPGSQIRGLCVLLRELEHALRELEDEILEG